MGRVHLAVDALPTFAGFPENQQKSLHRALVMLGADLDSFERAGTAQRAGEMIDDPAIELTIQSVHDNSLTPPGRHLITTGIQQLPFELKEGSWDDARERFAAQAIRAIERYAPGFENSVIGVRTITPLDLDRDYFLTQGNLFHGAMTLNQLFAERPLSGLERYRTPVSGVYLCGSGAHPGGGVTGAPGHNSARAVLADLGRTFRGETADWQTQLPPPRPDLIEQVLKRPRSRRVLVGLARSRWLRPVTNRARAE
jgi:phytoene dehydrogenase-like protein